MWLFYLHTIACYYCRGPASPCFLSFAGRVKGRVWEARTERSASSIEAGGEGSRGRVASARPGISAASRRGSQAPASPRQGPRGGRNGEPETRHWHETSARLCIILTVTMAGVLMMLSSCPAPDWSQCSVSMSAEISLRELSRVSSVATAL